MKVLQGWIFHVYASGQSTVVRVVDAVGHVYRLLDRFTPAFYVAGEPQECHAVARYILEQPWDVKVSRVEWPDSALGHGVRVLCVEVESPRHFAALSERVRHFRPKLTYYHHDLSLPELYLAAHQIRPLSLCEIAVDDRNRILGIETANTLPQDAGEGSDARS